MDWLMGRGKRKDKDSTSPTGTGNKLYLEECFTKESIHVHIPNLTLPNLEELVMLPYGFEQDEWLAWHTMSFFDQINIFIEVISSECSNSTCPNMSAPGNISYSWVDDKGKKIKCPAPQYIDYVTTHIHKTISDSTFFPSKYGEVFPSNFLSIVQRIHKYMFQVLAHIYCSHYQQMILLQLHGHLNTLFAHFMLFVRTFKLIEDKDTDNMKDLIKALKAIPLENKENQSST